MTLVREYQPTFVLGDGETKEFSYLFEEVSENFVKVIVKHSDDSTYVPVFSVDLDSHKVVFGESETAPLDTDIICIYRQTPDLQDTPFRTLQGYDAKALENILSKIVAMIQELKANGFSTQILQGTPWQLDLLHPDDDGASVVIDYNARILKKGLYFQIVSGNLQVSADGNSFITMPKSADITEFRRLETVLEDLTVIYRLQYKVDGVWYDADAYTGEKADEAVEIAKEARTIATGAKEVADEAKEIAEGIDGKAQQALDNSVEALETAEEAKEMIQDRIIVRSATMPTPSADLVGKNYQYAGTTNTQYTHNYIYECQTVENNTLAFTPNTVSCSWDNLSAFLSQQTSDYNSVVKGTLTYIDGGDLWRLVAMDAEDNVILSYQQYTGDWEGVGFTFAGTYEDGAVVSFERTTTTSYVWVRVNVQPDYTAEIQELETDVDNIQAVIPEQATPTNQLVTQNTTTQIQQQVNHLQTIGRFLSFWDATTGLAQTNPQTSPYIYQTGDYFRVGVVASGGGTNYKPSGSSYTTGVASTVIETEPLTVGQVYYYDGANWALAAGGNVAIDGATIVFNSNNELQAVATVNQNTAAGAINPVYDWTGTLQQAIDQNVRALHPDWKIYITDDVSGGDSVYTKTEVDALLTTMLESLYPVGSVYIGTQSACPMATLISGSTWELVSSGKALWTGDGTNGNTTIAAGLPNITGKWGANTDTSSAASRAFQTQTSAGAWGGVSGAFSKKDEKTNILNNNVIINPIPSSYSTARVPGFNLGFDASKSNSVYGNSTTVQPPAYVVNVWRRTA